MTKTYPPGIAYIDGQYVPMEEAKLSVLDWGFLRSDATYDVVHVWQGKFFRLDKHLDRFEESVRKLRMTLPMDRDALTTILRQCVIQAGHDNAYVEMILTRGVSPTFSRDPRDAENNFMAFAIPFGWIANEEQRERGLDVHISSVPRIPPESVDPTVKNYHWLDIIAALYEAYDADCENVVLEDGRGNVTEGPGFNLFCVKDGVVATPASGVLHGITRGTVLDLCAELQIKTEIRLVSATELRSADEVFLSSTAGGVMPITKLDGQSVKDGTIGPVTQRLTEVYWSKHTDPTWTTPVVAP